MFIKTKLLVPINIFIINFIVIAIYWHNSIKSTFNSQIVIEIDHQSIEQFFQWEELLVVLSVDFVLC
jgi:hypothetical protein